MHDTEEQEALPCADKLVFDSKKQAEAAAVVADYQRGVTLAAYRCQYCNLWHMKTVYD